LFANRVRRDANAQIPHVAPEAEVVQPLRHPDVVRDRRRVPTQRQLQAGAAVLAVCASVALAAASVWPFDTKPPALQPKPSLWQLLLSDRATLGFARFALIALMLFVIASVPALLVARRWLKAFGTSGLSADDAAQVDATVERLNDEVSTLRANLEQVERERNQARAIAGRLLRAQRRERE
jgi:hypothetical protein